MNEDYRPRFAAELRPDQAVRLKEILPHGMQKHLVQALVDGVIELYNKGGMAALGAIISGHIDTVTLAEAGKRHTKKSLEKL